MPNDRKKTEFVRFYYQFLMVEEWKSSINLLYVEKKAVNIMLQVLLKDCCGLVHYEFNHLTEIATFYFQKIKAML